MNATLALAVGMVRSWVALYTLGLPNELRSARRWEIDSDVWEQRQLAGITGEPPFGTAVEMLARTLFGAISDITWRVQAGLSTRPDRSINVIDSFVMRSLFIAAAGLAIAPAFFGVYVIGGGGEWSSAAERVLFGSLWVLAAASMAVGLFLTTRNPGLGVGLVALGAIGIAAMWFWLFFMTIPLGTALTYLAYRRARGTGWPRGASPA